MKLRGQLLLATAVVVALPLAGLRFVAGVERLLRDGHEQALIDNARALASVLPVPPVPAAGREALYVQRAGQPLALDGYGDDWHGWLGLVDRFAPGARLQSLAPVAPDADRPLNLALAESPSGLHVLLEMFDPDTRFATGPGRPGDRVELQLVEAAASGEGRTWHVAIEPAAPGRFTRIAGPGGPVVHGAWQVHPRGWNLELRIPARDRPDALGLAVFDAGAAGAPPVRLGPDGAAALVRPDPALGAELERTVSAAARAWITTAEGYILAGAGRPMRGAGAGQDDAPGGTATFWQMLLFERLAGDALAAGDGGSPARLAGIDVEAAAVGDVRPRWSILRAGPDTGVRVRVAVPMTSDRGSPLLVLERDADALMLLASDAVVRLIGASVVTFTAAAAVLLAFAWLLSRRIRRLQLDTERSVADNGRVVATPAPARGSDEIAGLSRSMTRLLERLRAHQQYLRTLADRLAHEFRTPLAMIDSSLDNLAARLGDAGAPAEEHDPTRVYLERAGQGTRRLNRILQAMSQATRLEESLIDEPFERFDLAALAADYCATRRETCGGVRLECGRPPRPVPVDGSPDLVAQMLDKLVDNALGFTPADGGIDVRVEVDGTTARLEVENDGPRIDEAGAGELFDPMVSYRHSTGQSIGETPHLGLGLFIARLIAERHGGRMSARPTRRGSAFRFEMPCAGS